MTAPPAQPATPYPPTATAGFRTPTRRNSELFLLLLAMGLVTAYSAAVEIGLTGKVTGGFWIPPLLLTIVFLAAHVMLRFLVPYADPAILPAVALLNGLGVAFLRRLDLGRALAGQHGNFPAFGGDGFRQLAWTVASLLVATGALILIKDHRALSRYAYTLGLTGIVLVMLPAVLPASLSEVNGAKLWIRFGTVFQIQPGEFAKLLLLSFFAYYLVRKREVLSLASRRVLGIEFPRGRDLGPVVAVWLLSLMVLVFGGAFLAYILGGRIGGPFANFYERVGVWLDPFADPNATGYQLVQSLLGLGTGGLFGSGPGHGHPGQIPEVRTDFIFAGLGEEIGLFGLTALLVVYLVIVERGLRAAIAVRDSFGKLLAGGLAFTLGLQVFVIVGGVTKLIPLTGQTTPFLSAGGSSLMANWLLVAMLLRISDASRRPVGAGGPAPGGGPVKLAGLATEVVR